MVALPAMVKTAKEKACKQGSADQAAAWPNQANGPHHNMLYTSCTSWPLECQEDQLRYPIKKSDTPSATAAPSPHVSGAVRPYSLSSHHAHSATYPRRSAISSSRSSSTCTSSAQSHATFSPALSTSASPPMTSLWDADEDHTTELPPIDPCDHMKTLLTQFASCISSITTAYAHQQAALISHQMRACDVEELTGHAAVADVISVTDKAMVRELHTLSHLHSQLALLPHMLPLKEVAGPDVKEQDSMAQALHLKRYEGIIAQFHDEIWRKNAVTEALKETLAKSMLKGEKLQQRLQALEAKFSTHLAL